MEVYELRSNYRVSSLLTIPPTKTRDEVPLISFSFEKLCCWTHKKNDNTKDTSKIRRKEREMIMTVEIRNVCTTSFFQVKTS